MPVVSGVGGEYEGLLHAVNPMLISYRTAPKIGGVDDVLTSIALGEGRECLANEMDKIGDGREDEDIKRDAESLRNSEATVLMKVSRFRREARTCTPTDSNQIGIANFWECTDQPQR